MAATVTGTFLLLDQASGPLQRIERQAQATDRAIADLGSRLDNIGTDGQMRQHEKLGQSLRDIDNNAKAAGGGMESLGDAIDETSDVAEKATGRMGRMGRSMLLVGGAIAALLPIVIDLAGALGALIGSLGAAIKGVGALGVALGGAIVVGLAGVAGAALAASERMKNLKSDFDDFKGTWSDLTRRGQNDFMAMIRDSMADVERMMPMLARSVNRTMPAARDAVDQFFNRLDSPQFARFLERMTTSFERIAGPMAQTLANIGQTLGNIAVAAAPFVEEMMRGISDITRGWAQSTNNIENLRENIRGAVDQARSWFDLLSATWDLTIAVFGSGADEGQGLVDDMTRKVEKYTKWVTGNPEKMDAFWKDAIAGTKELAKFLGSLRLPLKNLNDAMEPIVGAFERLVGALARLKIPGTEISGLTALVGLYAANKGSQALGQGGIFGGWGSPAKPAHVWVKNMRGGMGSPGQGGKGGSGGTVIGTPGRGDPADPDGKGKRGSKLRGMAGRGLVGALGLLFVGDAIANAATSNDTRRQFGMGPSAQERATAGIETVDPLAWLTGKGVNRRFGELVDPKNTVNTPLTASSTEIWFDLIQRQTGGARGVTPDGDWLGRLARSGKLPDLGIGSMTQMDDLSPKQTRGINQAVTSVLNRWSRTKAGSRQIANVNEGLGRTEGEMRTQRGMGNLRNWNKVAEQSVNPKPIKAAFDAIQSDAEKLNTRVKDDTSDKWHKTRKAMVGQMKEAYPELERAMRRIREMTIGELQGMGYSGTEARNMMNFAEGGGGQGRGDGSPAGGRNARPRPRDNAMGGRLDGFAGGGRIRGQGKKDTVPVTMGMAAPGELIVNRHTEGRVNSMLGMFGTDLGKEVGQETVPHAATPRPGHGPGKTHVYHAKGGRVAYPDAGGALPGLDALGYFLNKKFGLSVTSGLRPGAITSTGNMSDHGWGGAIDVSNGYATPQMDAAHAWLQSTFSGAIKQMLYRTMVGGNHFDHIHVALNEAYARNPSAVARLAGGRGIPIMLGGGGGGGAVPRINLNAPRSGLRGAPGMMSQAGMNTATRGMERAINRRLGAGGARVGRAGGGQVVGASVYGGARDPSSGTQGYQGDQLPGTMTYAELGYSGGDASSANLLGGLPYKAPLRISYGGRSVIARKRDIGAGGGDVQGKPRAIDLWHETAAALGFPFGVGLVKVQRMAQGGRLPNFGGWFGNGGKFTADKPTLIGVGEKGKETVEITPQGKAKQGGGGGGVSIANITINNHREGDIKKQVKRELSQAFNELEREIRSDTGTGIV